MEDVLTNHKPTGRATGMAAGLAWGAVSALLLIGVLSSVLAFLISRGVVRQENLGYGVMVILFLAGAMGYYSSYHKIKRRKLLVSILSAAIILTGLAALTALFFGGQYEGIFPTAMLINGGSGAALLLSMKSEMRPNRKKR